MPTITGAGDSLVFNLLQRTAARAPQWLHHTVGVHAETDLILCNLQNTNGLTRYLETFHFRIYSSWTAELGWHFLGSPAPHCNAEKKLRLFESSLLSWMACLYGRFCHQSWYYEHSHCYCLTIVNQLKTNRGVPEKYFISCNETGLQSCIWLPDWKDYKEQWFRTLRHFFSDLYAHRVRQMKIFML